jgi:hypothetical protein
MELCVTGIARDEGTVVLLLGMTTDGTDETWTFASDHRAAQAIMDTIATGEDVYVIVEPWQLCGKVVL